MFTCPVCEHVQASGDECAVCGKHEPAARAAGEASASRLPDLEPTLYEAGALAPTEPVSPLPGLEPTLYEPAAPHEPGPPALREPAAPAQREPGPPGPGEASASPLAALEPTLYEPAPTEPVSPLPDLEPHRPEPLPDDGEPAGPGPAVCRYCRTAAASGDRFCGRCGMRLPRFDPVAVALSELGELVCPECGAIGEGPRCRRCGAAMVRR